MRPAPCLWFGGRDVHVLGRPTRLRGGPQRNKNPRRKGPPDVGGGICIPRTADFAAGSKEVFLPTLLSCEVFGRVGFPASLPPHLDPLPRWGRGNRGRA